MNRITVDITLSIDGNNHQAVSILLDPLDVSVDVFRRHIAHTFETTAVEITALSTHDHAMRTEAAHTEMTCHQNHRPDSHQQNQVLPDCIQNLFCTHQVLPLKSMSFNKLTCRQYNKMK